MKITIENTSEIVHINDVPARIWKGQTESGIEVHCLITRVAVLKTQDCSQFEKELQETPPPAVPTDGVFPMRMII